MIRSIANLPILIVGTYRDNVFGLNPPFARTLADLLRDRLVTQIKLRGLTRAELATMVKAISGQTPPERLVQEIYNETEGYPFFVEEVFQWLDEEQRLYDAEGKFQTDLGIAETEAPHNVRLVIERRLARVTTSASGREGFVYDLLRFAQDRIQVRPVLEAFRVDLVDAFGSGRTRREPAAGR